MSNISLSLRREVFLTSKACCEFRRHQEEFSTSSFTVEHIVPISKGGSDELENLACSCPTCNFHKYNKTQGLDWLTRQMVPLFNPRKQIWAEHFAWDASFCEIVGLTPIGRATVKVLNMNRLESMNLRRVLASVGKHPPD